MSINTALYGPSTAFHSAPPAEKRAVPMTVQIAGVTYPIETAEYRRGGLDLLREQVVTSDQPDDQLFDSRGTWWRYRFTFAGGQGQRVADMGERQDPERYWRSIGVDVWDEYELKLLPSVTKVGQFGTVDGGLLRVGPRLYHWDASSVRYTTSILGTPTWTTVTGITGTVRDITSDGLTAYIATSTNLFQVGPTVSAATTVTSAAAPSGGYHSVGFASNRLLASASHRLYEVKVATLDQIVEHYQPEFRWNAIFSVGSRIYVGGFAGDRTEINQLQTLSDGALAIGVDTSPPAAGEKLRDVLSYGGAALVATDRGVRFASLVGDATLAYGPLITEPGDVRALASQDRFVWFGWSCGCVFDIEGHGTGRMDLSRQTQGQPAYATDVYVPNVDTATIGVARFQDRTVFLNELGEVWRSNDGDGYMASGYLETGDIYFGAIETKVLTEALVRFDPLAADETVSAEVHNERADVLGQGNVVGPGTTDLQFGLEGYTANLARMTLQLGGPGTSTPLVRMWRLSAFPSAPPTEQWIVPIIIHHSVLVNDGLGEIQTFDVEAQIDRLVAFWRTKRVITYAEGSRSYRVRIDNYEIQPQRWDDEGNYFEVKLVLRLYSIGGEL